MTPEEFEVQLVKIANELEERGLYKEASEIDGMVKEGGEGGGWLYSWLTKLLTGGGILSLIFRKLWANIFIAKNYKVLLDNFKIVESTGERYKGGMVIIDWLEVEDDLTEINKRIINIPGVKGVMEKGLKQYFPMLIDTYKEFGRKINLTYNSASYKNKVMKIILEMLQDSKMFDALADACVVALGPASVSAEEAMAVKKSIDAASDEKEFVALASKNANIALLLKIVVVGVAGLILGMKIFHRDKPVISVPKATGGTIPGASPAKSSDEGVPKAQPDYTQTPSTSKSTETTKSTDSAKKPITKLE